MRVHLHPVYSKLAGPELLAEILRGRSLPTGYELREHQAMTLQALEDPAVDIVANTAITGDGKSLAAYSQVLLGTADSNPRTVLGLYPTIELSRDQERQFGDYQRRFQTTLRWESLWGAKLTELESGEYGGRANALLTLLRTNDVVLTNPDIFSRIMNFQYQSGIYTRQELPWTAITHFHLLLFDEFHLFSMPQFVSAVTALTYAQETARKWRPKALFSSATQHPALLGLIHRAGMHQRLITGSYTTGPEPGYSPILHPADLHIHQLTGEQNAESWIWEHVHFIEDAWRTCDGKHPRVAIIVSSVATARRVANFLAGYFASCPLKPGGLRVEEITGLARGSLDALDADIVVGTSTIDVGVDFHINLLIFEALNAGQFLQRLGRLGRFHGDEQVFASYSAHALISAKTPWISQRIESALHEAGVGDGDAVDRPHTLRAAIEASYPSETDFESYARRWGAVQGYHTVHVLRHELREYGDDESAYEPLAADLEARYVHLFDWKSLRPIKGRYYRLKNDQVEGQALLDEVLSFRGSSPFQVALWDASRKPTTADCFTVYDLFFVLQATNWQPIAEEEFFQALRNVVPSSEIERQDREFRWVLRDKHERPLCMRVSSFLEDRERLLLGLERYVEDEYLLDRPVAIKGVRVEEPRTGAALSEVNNVLARARVVCYITRQSIPELRRYRLPALFPLYRLRVHGMSAPCTVTFGKPALMLDALLRTQRRRRATSPDDRPIFS